MEYKRFKNKIVARIDKGEEILGSIKSIALKENIKLASVRALGATNNFTVGVYKIEEKKYYSKAFMYYRKEWIEKNIGKCLIVVLVLFLVPFIIKRNRP